MNKQDYVTWIDKELAESRHTLEEKLHQPVTSLAYPYGGYDELIVERTRLAGYKTATTCDDGDVDDHTDPLRLNRRLVFRQTSLKPLLAILWIVRSRLKVYRLVMGAGQGYSQGDQSAHPQFGKDHARNGPNPGG